MAEDVEVADIFVTIHTRDGPVTITRRGLRTKRALAAREGVQTHPPEQGLNTWRTLQRLCFFPKASCSPSTQQ